jgi:molybdopterin-binding protein
MFRYSQVGYYDNGVPSKTSPIELSFAENVCLALIVQGDSHGWALGAVLAPDGEIGRVWTLSRPLTYRAIDALTEKGLIFRQAPTSGRGRDRLLLSATPAGRKASRRWLDAPIKHLRDVRTELLVKLTLRTRAGMDNALLIQQQLAEFAPAIDVLTERAGTDAVDVWRREHARAVRRFLNHTLHPITETQPVRPEMRLSARNQIRATVIGVQRGELMASVKAVLGDGQTLTATITQEATDDLDIAVGDSIVVIVKATEVMVAKDS